MNRYSRRILPGIFAGGITSLALIHTVPHPVAGVLLAISGGAAYSASMPHTRGAYVDNMMTAPALGLPLCAFISVVAMPLLSAPPPDLPPPHTPPHFSLFFL